MQLTKFSAAIKPLTLAVGLFSTANAVAYNSIDDFTGIRTVASNLRTSEYIKSDDRLDQINMLINEHRFRDHLIRWEKRTMFLSSINAIIENEDFQAIVSMGYQAVPLIIREIESHPSTLVWALNLIYKQKITNDPKATISDACKQWVKKLKI